MRARWIPWVTAAVAVLFGRALLAGAATPVAAQDQSPTQVAAKNIQASKLIGTMVTGSQGQEKIGKIKDILLDPQTGQATFVAIDSAIPDSRSGMLVVPFTALKFSSNPTDHGPSATLDLQSRSLQVAPRIANNEEQLLQNPQFLEDVCNFYQPRTYTTARPIEAAPALSPPAIQPAVAQPYVQYVLPPPVLYYGQPRTPMSSYQRGFYDQ